MPLAEQIAYAVLKSLGYREPQNFSQWQNVVDIIQRKINQNMDLMRDVAYNEAIREIRSESSLRKRFLKWLKK